MAVGRRWWEMYLGSKLKGFFGDASHLWLSFGRLFARVEGFRPTAMGTLARAWTSWQVAICLWMMLLMIWLVEKWRCIMLIHAKTWGNVATRKKCLVTLTLSCWTSSQRTFSKFFQSRERHDVYLSDSIGLLIYRFLSMCLPTFYLRGWNTHLFDGYM